MGPFARLRRLVSSDKTFGERSWGLQSLRNEEPQMNTLSLIGNLTKDPERRHAADTPVCAIRLATSNGPDTQPLYINVSIFGRQAEECMHDLAKGSRVAVVGQLCFREWKADDGAHRSEYSVATERIDLLASPEPPNSDDEPSGQRQADLTQPGHPGKSACINSASN